MKVTKNTKLYDPVKDLKQLINSEDFCTINRDKTFENVKKALDIANVCADKSSLAINAEHYTNLLIGCEPPYMLQNFKKENFLKALLITIEIVDKKSKPIGLL